MSKYCFLKTCSCPSVRYFRTLFWDDITIIWYEKVWLLNFHQQIIVTSSQNTVRKYRTKGHEQVFIGRFCIYWGGGSQMHCGFVQGVLWGILLGSVWVYWVVGSLRGSLRGLRDPMRRRAVGCSVWMSGSQQDLKLKIQRKFFSFFTVHTFVFLTLTLMRCVPGALKVS